MFSITRVERQSSYREPVPSTARLQRKCSCGGSAAGSAECEECREEGLLLERKSDGHGQFFKVASIGHDVLRLSGQALDQSGPAFFEPLFCHDLSHVTVNPLRRTASTPAERVTESSVRFLPAGPRPVKRAVPPGPTARPGTVDPYITGTQPAKITAPQILTTGPLDAASAGLSFQLARHAKFQQDEYVVGDLQWNRVGKTLPPSKQEEELGIFTHAWTSHTVDRPDLPGNPTMLKDSDGHTWGLAVVPGLECEQAAKKHSPPFDRLKNDWLYTEHGNFIDTVTFPDKEIKRVYFFDCRAEKQGASIAADVEYSNVDRVDKV